MGRTGIWTLVLLTLVLSRTSNAQLVLYDNFNSKQIDPARWIGERSSPDGSDANRREVAVQLVGEENQRLRISETVYSANTGNTGSGGDGFGLGFASPNNVTAVSFTLALTKDSPTSCAGNPGFGWAGAGFFGDYFNPTGAQDGAIGDIAASVSVGRFWADPAGSLTVGASIVRCNDLKCDNQATMSSQTLGNVQMGSTNGLSVTWDHSNHQFIFQLNNDSPVPLAYTESDTFPPGLPDKSFFVFGDVPHCTTKPRPSASIDALFDNVFVNR
jgi:hypothetical protein